MKKTLLLIAASLLFSGAKAQNDSVVWSGWSLQGTTKLSEFLSNGFGAEVMLMKFNHHTLFQPYVSLAAGFGSNKKDELWKYHSYAFSGKIGAACRLTEPEKDEFRLYLRPGLGYIRRMEELEIIVENEHWGTSNERLKENTGSFFLDMGVRMEAKVGRTVWIVAEPSFYVIANNVPEEPFDNRVEYRQKFDSWPNQGLGAGKALGINLSVGVAILIQ